MYVLEMNLIRTIEDNEIHKIKKKIERENTKKT